MHKIWTEYSTGKIDAIEALARIGESLEGASKAETKTLMKVSEMILDKEVPLEERNAEAEDEYLTRNGLKEEE
jgi:hypothetical protein